MLVKLGIKGEEDNQRPHVDSYLSHQAADFNYMVLIQEHPSSYTFRTVSDTSTTTAYLSGI